MNIYFVLDEQEEGLFLNLELSVSNHLLDLSSNEQNNFGAATILVSGIFKHISFAIQSAG